MHFILQNKTIVFKLRFIRGVMAYVCFHLVGSVHTQYNESLSYYKSETLHSKTRQSSKSYPHFYSKSNLL